MSEIPEPKRCIEILKENGCPIAVINHCIAVRDLAIKIAEKTNADMQLVEAGALLHDLGRSKTHGISHGVKGALIAKKIGLPPEIINIIERHVGAGIAKDEAAKLGLPAKDFIPMTLEEKIVTHADNLIQRGKKQLVEKEIKKALRKGQKNHAKRLLELHKELSIVCGIDINEIDF
jgi:uncharacterized protein (TIGR00295 family)